MRHDIRHIFYLVLLLAAVLAPLWVGPQSVTYGTGGLFAPDATPAIHESFATYTLDPTTGLTTLSVVQGVRLNTDRAFWVVPIQGEIEAWDLSADRGPSALITVTANPNPCKYLYPPDFLGGHGEFYGVERTDQAQIVSGPDIQSFLADVGLELGALVAPYANAEWSFLVNEVRLTQVMDNDTSVLIGMRATVTYRPSSETIRVPVDWFAASYTNDMANNPFSNPVTPGRVMVEIISTDFYVPADPYLTPDFSAAPTFHALDNVLAIPYEAYLAVRQAAYTADPSQWVASYRGVPNPDRSDLQRDLDAAFQRGDLAAPIQLQTAVYEQRLQMGQPHPAGVFVRQPDAPPLDTFDVTAADPAQYYGCSTRTLDDGDPLRQVAVTPFAELAPLLPPQRVYLDDLKLEVFVPDGWVRRAVIVGETPVTVFAPQPVTRAEVAAYVAGQAAPPMLAVYAGPQSVLEGYYPPLPVHLELSPYQTILDRPVAAHETDGWDYDQVVVAWLLSEADYRADAARYDAVLEAVHLYRHASHPDLLHTLYLKPDDYAFQDSTSLLRDLRYFQIGQPAGYIETLTLDPLQITFTNPDTGATIWVDLTLANACETDATLPSSRWVAQDGVCVVLTAQSGVDAVTLAHMAESVVVRR